MKDIAYLDLNHHFTLYLPVISYLIVNFVIGKTISGFSLSIIKPWGYFSFPKTINCHYHNFLINKKIK